MHAGKAKIIYSMFSVIWGVWEVRTMRLENTLEYDFSCYGFCDRFKGIFDKDKRKKLDIKQ